MNEKLYTQFDFDESDNEWHTLVRAWKEHAVKAEAKLAKAEAKLAKAEAKLAKLKGKKK